MSYGFSIFLIFFSVISAFLAFICCAGFIGERLALKQGNTKAIEEVRGVTQLWKAIFPPYAYLERFLANKSPTQFWLTFFLTSICIIAVASLTAAFTLGSLHIAANPTPSKTDNIAYLLLVAIPSILLGVMHISVALITGKCKPFMTSLWEWFSLSNRIAKNAAPTRYWLNVMGWIFLTLSGGLTTWVTITMIRTIP